MTAKEAQSEAPSVDGIFAPELRTDNYGHTYIDGDGIDRVKAKINRLITEARLDELKLLDSEAKPVDIDMHGQTYVNDGPTYVVFHSQIVKRKEHLSNNLSKGGSE